jgi:hypothetical protein
VARSTSETGMVITSSFWSTLPLLAIPLVLISPPPSVGYA